MDSNSVKNMRLIGDRRLSAEGLAQLLLATPITITPEKNSELTAHMGLGRIVYIRPTRGRIINITTGQEVNRDFEDNTFCVLNYRGQKFDVAYAA